MNIKLDKCGGLTEALAMVREARRLGLDVMVGNMMGSSLAMAPAFVVAQLCDYVDLDGLWQIESGFHDALVKRKYRWLFTPKRRRKPGPKGPGPELVTAIVQMKRRNPRFGCRRIAQQIALLFGVEIDKDVVRRVLAKHCRPTGGSDGPSWLTFLGHAKDSLWSVVSFVVNR